VVAVEETLSVSVLLSGVGIVTALVLSLAVLAWTARATFWKPDRQTFVLPEMLDAPTWLIAQAARERAAELGYGSQAQELVTNTLAYVATANQLMTQGLSLVQANSLLRVQRDGALYSFVSSEATRVASERQALLK